MHMLSIVFGSASIALLFKTKEAALVARDKTNADYQDANIEDDFGQSAMIRGKSIHGVVLEDLDASKYARAHQMLQNLHAQNIAGKLATSDPALRQGQSPAVITPHMNGMFPRQ